jgi:hypothetical protein
MKVNKFNIGDTVRFIGDTEDQAGKVLSLSFDGSEWVYKISAKEVDFSKREIIDGIKHCKESELKVVKTKK